MLLDDKNKEDDIQEDNVVKQTIKEISRAESDIHVQIGDDN